MTERRNACWTAICVFLCIGLGWFFHLASNTDEVVQMGSRQDKEPPTNVINILPLGAQHSVKQLAESSELLPGNWGVFEKGRLRPTAQLKVRFDHWLDGRSENTLETMRQLVQKFAIRDLGLSGSQSVLEIWDIYVDLLVREELAQNRADENSNTPEEWIATRLDLMNQAKARLGHGWGEMFFEQEEVLFQQLVKGVAAQRSHSLALELPP
jgi:hypothetical protein